MRRHKNALIFSAGVYHFRRLSPLAAQVPYGESDGIIQIADHKP